MLHSRFVMLQMHILVGRMYDLPVIVGRLSILGWFQWILKCAVLKIEYSPMDHKTDGSTSAKLQTMYAHDADIQGLSFGPGRLDTDNSLRAMDGHNIFPTWEGRMSRALGRALR
jgi:hypothetical protein